MSEPDEAMVEAVASAVDLCVDGWNGEPWSMAQEVARAVLSVPVVRDALARDGRAGCHAITDDDGTTYCPLAEANMRAVARDAQVREIVAGSWLGGNADRRPVSYLISDMAAIAALYPSPGDRDDSEEQR